MLTKIIYIAAASTVTIAGILGILFVHVYSAAATVPVTGIGVKGNVMESDMFESLITLTHKIMEIITNFKQVSIYCIRYRWITISYECINRVIVIDPRRNISLYRKSVFLINMEETFLVHVCNPFETNWNNTNTHNNVYCMKKEERGEQETMWNTRLVSWIVTYYEYVIHIGNITSNNYF